MKEMKEMKLASDLDALSELPKGSAINKRSFLKKVGDIYESDLFPDDWNKSEVDKASGELLNTKFTSGYWSRIPKMCTEKCLHAVDGTCKLSKKPFGSPCPEEKAFVELLMRRYMEELNVSDEDMSTLSMVRDLCDIEIQLIRKQGLMARIDMVYEEPIFDMNGELTSFVKFVSHPVFGQQSELLKRKSEIMKSLVATREARLKAAGDLINDDEMSKMAKALKEMKRQLAFGNIDGGRHAENYVDEFVDVEPDDAIIVDPSDG
jgi:hypothetical protein